MLLLDRTHGTEVHWWGMHILPALFARDTVILFGVGTMGCFYLHGGQTLSDRSNDKISV